MIFWRSKNERERKKTTERNNHLLYILSNFSSVFFFRSHFQIICESLVIVLFHWFSIISLICFRFLTILVENLFRLQKTHFSNILLWFCLLFFAIMQSTLHLSFFSFQVPLKNCWTQIPFFIELSSNFSSTFKDRILMNFLYTLFCFTNGYVLHIFKELSFGCIKWIL